MKARQASDLWPGTTVFQRPRVFSTELSKTRHKSVLLVDQTSDSTYLTVPLPPDGRSAVSLDLGNKTAVSILSPDNVPDHPEQKDVAKHE